MKNKFRCISLILVLLFLINNNKIVNAQIDSTTLLLTPYQCIENHLSNLQPETFDILKSSKSFSIVNQELASKNAVQLKQILDARGHYIYMTSVPEKANYIDTLSKKSIYFPFPKKLPQIYLQKYDNEWLYSEETNNAIPILFKKTYPFGSHKLVSYFAQLNQVSVLGIALWQFIAFLVLLTLAFLFYKIISEVIHYVSSKIVKTKYSSLVVLDNDHKLSNPISLLIILHLLSLFLPILQLNVRWSNYMIKGFNIATSVIIGLLLIRLIDILLIYLTKLTNQTESKLDEQLMPMLKRLLKIIVFIVTLMYVLNLLNINITALIAGVSIGGLALALAAQDTVKNLIGSLMIFLDAPFQIGDYIQVNGMEGTVIEVGFRSTKIRTSDTSIITIPNGTLSSTPLVNKGMRSLRLFNITLTLTYETKPKDIKLFINGLKEIILNHPRTSKEGNYVHLVNLNSSSIDVMFRTNIMTTAYNEELEIKESIYFSIIELAEDLGVEFAFPSQSIYLNKT